jgi:hypothetical protein
MVPASRPVVVPVLPLELTVWLTIHPPNDTNPLDEPNVEPV